MKKTRKVSMAAIIIILLVCLDFVLVGSDMPHAVVIAVFSNTLVVISMSISYYNNKKDSLGNKIFVRNGMVFVFAWWWSIISYIIFYVWDISFVTVIIALCMLVIIWQSARYITIREILRYPFYLLCLFQGK